MRSFLLNKLVRDKIFISMQELGQKSVHRKLNQQEYVAELKKKLLEEANEFDPNDPKAVNELADLLEVIDALAKELKIDVNDLKEVQAKRRKKAGGFKDRMYVERLDLEEDDPWAEYYAADPERFKEV